MKRWQTAATIWTLVRDYPVIPSVAYSLNDSCTMTYYRFTMPYLRTCLTRQSSSLAHFSHYAVLDLTWSLSPRLSYVYLLDSSDGILEDTVPVKLPTRHFPFFFLYLRLVRLRFVEVSHLRHIGYLIPVTNDKLTQCLAIVKLHRVSRNHIYVYVSGLYFHPCFLVFLL